MSVVKQTCLTSPNRETMRIGSLYSAGIQVGDAENRLKLPSQTAVCDMDYA